MTTIVSAFLAAILIGGGQSPPLTLDEARALEIGLDLKAALASSASRSGEQTPAAPLNAYVRTYWRAELDGQPRIIALYVRTPHVRDADGHGRLEVGEPRIVFFDGGCDVIEATFDPASHALLTIDCNGLA